MVRLFNDYQSRLEYLKLNGAAFNKTFGWRRQFNQRFYKSMEWKDVRERVIYRDDGCDLGIPGWEIRGVIIVHHINPLTYQSIIELEDGLLDMDNLISVSHRTHQAIHYAVKSPVVMLERQAGDTALHLQGRYI